MLSTKDGRIEPSVFLAQLPSVQFIQGRVGDAITLHAVLAFFAGVVQVLCLGGTFVVKIFMGSEAGNYKSYLRSRFEIVCSTKPR